MLLMMNIEIEIHTWSSSSSQTSKTQESMIELDSQKIPENVRDYLDQFKLI